MKATRTLIKINGQDYTAILNEDQEQRLICVDYGCLFRERVSPQGYKATP